MTEPLDLDPDATQQLGDWGRYYGGGFNTIRDVVTEYLTDDTGTVDAPDALIDEVARRYGTAINAALSSEGVRLVGDTFYARPDAVDTSEDVITQVLDQVSVSAVVDDTMAEAAETAAAADRSGDTAGGPA